MRIEGFGRSRMRRTSRGQLVVFLVVLLAAFVRLAWITAPPFDFSVSRQTYDALRARLIYLDGAASLPRWKQAVLTQVRPDVPQLEPPLMEHVAAAAYRLAGSEQLWIPRTVSVVLWLLGGAFVYRLGRRVGASPVPMAALALYLFLPFGIFASRSFQPDPLMVMLTLAALLLVVRLDEKPSGRRFFAACFAAAIAVLSKPPVAAFFLLSAYGSLAAARNGWRRGLLAPRAAIFAGASVVPSLVYYRLFLNGSAGGYLQPSLVTDPFFGRGWMSTIGTVLAYPMAGLEGRRLSGFILLALDLLVAALMLLGLRRVRKRQNRALLIGLWIGYAAFGIAFAPKISTHDYYSLLLIPIIALSVSPLAEPLRRWLQTAGTSARAASASAVCIAVAGLGWQVARALDDPHYREQVAMYQRIGNLTHHTSHGIHIEQYFQSPLLYYGWLASATLAYPQQDIPRGYIEQQLRQIRRDHGRPRYLIVTSLDEIATQPRLQAYVARLRPLTRTKQFAIFVIPSVSR